MLIGFTLIIVSLTEQEIGRILFPCLLNQLMIGQLRLLYRFRFVIFVKVFIFD